MTQCLTFQCQEQLPGLGHCELWKRNEKLRGIVLALVRDAMPDNWQDSDGSTFDDAAVAAWRTALEELGIDPETMEMP